MRSGGRKFRQGFDEDLEEAASMKLFQFAYYYSVKIFTLKKTCFNLKRKIR